MTLNTKTNIYFILTLLSGVLLYQAIQFNFIFWVIFGVIVMFGLFCLWFTIKYIILVLEA